MRIEYEQVVLYSTTKGKCRYCGKRAQRTKEFMQTINPWNTKDGRPKTREEIYDELIEERREWLIHGPGLAHEKCEREARAALERSEGEAK